MSNPFLACDIFLAIVDYVLRGNQIKVAMAEKSAPRPSAGAYQG